jgi:hypothetical protein
MRLLFLCDIIDDAFTLHVIGLLRISQIEIKAWVSIIIATASISETVFMTG